jgi:protein arginine kinase activator
VDICEDCALAKKMTDPSNFTLANLLDNIGGSNDEIEGDLVQCESCGLSTTDFKSLGRFGCPACYESFKDLLEPMLNEMQKSTTHQGKIPLVSAQRVASRNQIQLWEDNLQNAIEAERYEDAAQWRDKITQLKNDLKSKV